MMAKRLAVLDSERCVGCQSCMFACALRLGEGGVASSCIWVRTLGGVRTGYVVVVCRACPDPPCARVCPTDALVPRDGGGVRLQASLCIGCKNCVEACPFGAVLWNEHEGKPQICVYCGLCVPFCPYDVIALQDIEVSHASQ
jgi:anaerobic carbon-monoxide dehydrogenase iron sulfur subunit